MKTNRVYIWISVSIFLIFLDYFGLLSFLKDNTSGFVTVVKKGVFKNGVSVYQFGDILFNYNKLHLAKTDNLTLQKDNKDLNFRLKQLTEENTKLRQQLDAPLPASYKFIPGHVLGISRFMDLGIGEKEGIRRDMAVVDKSILIGKVQTVGKNISQVILLNDAEIQIAAKTANGISGVINGQYGESILFDKVLQKDPLFVGDEVLTSGEDGLPPDLLIGNIVYINSDDVSVYKRAKVKSPLNFFDENILFVVSTY